MSKESKINPFDPVEETDKAKIREVIFKKIKNVPMELCDIFNFAEKEHFDLSIVSEILKSAQKDNLIIKDWSNKYYFNMNLN